MPDKKRQHAITAADVPRVFDDACIARLAGIGKQGDLKVVHLDGADYMLHPACKGPWLQRHAATAGNAEPDGPCCERCHQSDGMIAPYSVTVSDGILFISPADGDHGVPLHSSCWFAWGREEAKKRGLRFSGWGSPQTRMAR